MATQASGAPRAGVLRRRESVAGYVFVLPWIISLVVFTSYPVIAAFYLSLTNYNIVEAPVFVGLANYRTMVTADPSFVIGIRNSAYYALLAVPIGLVVSFALALVLNLRTRIIGLYRTIYYLPALAPPVAGTIVFLMMFDPGNGLVNTVLRNLSLPAPGWFTNPSWSKPALVVLSLWTAGSATLIFLAGLREVPETLLEAAAIDGAGPIQKYRHVTIPLMTPVILFNLVMGIIWSFQVFTQAYVIGGTGGQPLESLLMYTILIYRNAFRYFQMGYASALSVVLFAAVLIITAIIFWSSGKWVYYEGSARR